MATTTQAPDLSGAEHLIETVQDAEKSSLEAIRRFVDTVNDAFPDVGEDGPRKKIIDSAFRMTEQIIAASNKLAQNVVDLTEKALQDGEGDSPS